MSKKREKVNAMQASTALARQKGGTPGHDRSGTKLPEKQTTANDAMARSQQAFATKDTELIYYLSLQAASTASGDPTHNHLANRSTFAAVHSLGARDGTEVLLAVQMVGVHNLAMKLLAGAAMKEQTFNGADLCISQANRLLRTFALQVETLKRHRSKGEQHCIVEHVHVHSGGQAVVGAVTAISRERGGRG